MSPVLCVFLVACASPPAPRIPSLPPATVSSPASPESRERIKVEPVSLTADQFRDLTTLPRISVATGSRWFVRHRPNTMLPGPWSTQIYIFDSAAPRRAVRLDLLDHASYDVHCSWQTDKMLFVRVWWGRIAGTDFVLNTENMNLVCAQNLNCFGLVYSQETQ